MLEENQFYPVTKELYNNMLISKWNKASAINLKPDQSEEKKYKTFQNNLYIYQKALIRLLDNFYYSIKTDFKNNTNLFSFKLDELLADKDKTEELTKSTLKNYISTNKSLQNLKNNKLMNAYMDLISAKILTSLDIQTDYQPIETKIKGIIEEEKKSIYLDIKELEKLEIAFKNKEVWTKKEKDNIETLNKILNNIHAKINSLTLPNKVALKKENNVLTLYKTTKKNNILYIFGKNDARILKNDIDKIFNTLISFGFLNSIKGFFFEEMINNVINDFSAELANTISKNITTVKSQVTGSKKQNNRTLKQDIEVEFQPMIDIKLGVSKNLDTRKLSNKVTSGKNTTLANPTNSDKILKNDILDNEVLNINKSVESIKNSFNSFKNVNNEYNNVKKSMIFLNEALSLTIYQKNMFKLMLDEKQKKYSIGTSSIEKQIRELWTIANSRIMYGINVTETVTYRTKKDKTFIDTKNSLDLLMASILEWSYIYSIVKESLTNIKTANKAINFNKNSTLFSISSKVILKKPEYEQIRAIKGFQEQAKNSSYNETSVDSAKKYYKALNNYVKSNTKISIKLNQVVADKTKNLEKEKTKKNMDNVEKQIIKIKNSYLTYKNNINKVLLINEKTPINDVKKIQENYRKSKERILKYIRELYSILLNIK